MNKIQRVSLFFRVLFQIVFITWPIVLIIAWCNAPQSFILGYPDYGFSLNFYPAVAYKMLHPFTAMTKTLGFIINAAQESVTFLVLYFLIKLFKLYEKGEIFSIKNVSCIRNIGYFLLIGQFIVNPICEFLMGLALTWHNPPLGMRQAMITLSPMNVGIIFTALLIILISWIMAEGCKLREEQKLTI